MLLCFFLLRRLKHCKAGADIIPSTQKADVSCSLWQGVYLHLIRLAKCILGKQHTKKETICPCFPLALTSESVLEKLKHVDKASEKICSAAIGLDFFPSKSLRMRVVHTIYCRCVLGGPSLQGSPGLNFWPSQSDKTRRDAMTQTLLFGLLTQNVGHWSAGIASGWLVGGCWLCPLPCLQPLPRQPHLLALQNTLTVPAAAVAGQATRPLLPPSAGMCWRCGVKQQNTTNFLYL